jgi:hypothetical protein
MPMPMEVESRTATGQLRWTKDLTRHRPVGVDSCGSYVSSALALPDGGLVFAYVWSPSQVYVVWLDGDGEVQGEQRLPTATPSMYHDGPMLSLDGAGRVFATTSPGYSCSESEGTCNYLQITEISPFAMPIIVGQRSFDEFPGEGPSSRHLWQGFPAISDGAIAVWQHTTHMTQYDTVSVFRTPAEFNPWYGSIWE